MSDLSSPRAGWSLEPDRPPPPRRGLYRLLAGVVAGLAYLIELRFAPERSGAWLWQLPLACYLLVSSIPYFRLRPPEDELSRLRSPLTPALRAGLITLSFAGLLGSAWWAAHSLTPHCPPLATEVLAESTAPGFGCRSIKGRALPSEFLRWEHPFESPDEAPYLTPVEEFSGRLLLISADRLADEEGKAARAYQGRLQPFPYGSEIRTLTYRSRWHLAARSPLYLLDLRPELSFAPEPWAGLIAALLLLLTFWSSPSRRSGQQGSRLYIPPELFESLESEGEGQPEGTHDDEPAEVDSTEGKHD
ncbi:MAG: hypothetical protein VYD19_05790 [Myxococcota bacterium]|nr:hypothetical protein [Myxococcota bacterium]